MTYPGPYEPEDLLIKLLADEATPEEKAWLEAWLDLDPANRRQLEDFRRIWTESRHIAAISTVDENAAWNRFQERVQHQPRVIRPRFGLLRAAAIIGLLIGISGIVYLFIRSSVDREPIAWASGTTPASRTLSDGSTVVLNKSSQLDYPKAFRGKERAVTLKGEGFFKVTPDKQHPFVVRTGNVIITVLGTSFNIRQAGNKTIVTVASGKVQVSRNAQQITLGPGEKTIVPDKDTLLQKTGEPDKLYQYYSTRTFVCDNTPLWKLAETLEQAYNVKIDIRTPALRELRLTTTFHEEPLEQIIRVITETFDIKASRNGENYILE
ncbi:FecR domain-containing protein [Flavihumibacter petaseus]|uniref:Putative anti-sigma factor n=1 Tax=Flavihumibacter petaseus NBRC 106054 TaxID=1220578 RepID=A0A0E9N0S6_9BACT|nr:FecR domain-containing protein [Flavihumibacter petaseus]GAO43434.1 putative anti-sigma factor [Flavihumibacter petaseus NBRC 106054]